jgi:hypothetical protein
MIEAGNPTTQYVFEGMDYYKVFNEYLYASVFIQSFPKDPTRIHEVVGTVAILPANALE